MYKEYNGMSLLFTNYIDTALAMILDYSINYYTVTNPITMPVGSLHLNGTDTALPGSLHLIMAPTLLCIPCTHLTFERYHSHYNPHTIHPPYRIIP